MFIWILTFVALAGTLLNARQDRRGFLLWMVSNTGLCIWNFTTGDFAQMTLFLCYLILAVYGFFSWKNSPK